MKQEKEQPQKSVREAERVDFGKISELLNLVDEEKRAFDRAMALVDKEGEEGAKIEVKENGRKKELIIRLKKDNSIIFYNDFGEEEHAEEIERQLREEYN